MKVIIVILALAAFAAQAEQCIQFNGQKYCAVDEGVAKPMPCTSTSCLTPDYTLKLPTTEQTVYVPPPTVIAPTDANGQPAKFVNVCSTSGCSVSQAPVVVEQYVPPPPPTIWWYQPPAVAVPKVAAWGVWDTMTGNPPLRRHR